MIATGMLEALGALAAFAGRLGLVLLIGLAVLVPAYLVVVGTGGLARALDWIGTEPAGAIRWRRGVAYAPGHTWAQRRSGRSTLRVGIDDLARRLIGHADSVLLPRLGAEVRAGEVVAMIACGGKRARIASPVGGVVTGVNEALRASPSLIHRAPYGRGWLYDVEPAGGGERLIGGERSRDWLREEDTRLARFLDRNLGVAAADGGDFLAAPELLDEAQWEALTGAFLRWRAARFEKERR